MSERFLQEIEGAIKSERAFDYGAMPEIALEALGDTIAGSCRIQAWRRARSGSERTLGNHVWPKRCEHNSA